MDKKCVLIVDDHPLFREGLKSLVERSANYRTVGEAGSGKEALTLAAELKPDLVTMDVSLPDMNGIEVVRAMLKVIPEAKVLMLSMYPKFDYVSEAFKAGAKGYVVKETTSARLIQGFDALCRGEFFVDGQVSQDLVAKLSAAPTREVPTIQEERYALLTPREQQVLRLVAEGVSTRKIADSMKLSPKTVENHRTNLMKKLDVHSKMELVKYAARVGLVDMDSWR
ncbi:response regulator transcription factor [Geomonas paludis]|uniref:DNA-binding response regulator n=1 Tax=Geomonas paludis TaxID=2740185 RepID=A0A6V8MXF6_9BACT|nr:response regulator transcription factor [Geomonas paludis]UPU37143.1 response regulator transcription factor [Geomonas paludis]GFO64760.1 DNA-binding response regulator [Geomonas paludis]